jgi:methylase of polypeptide subunit release factors
MAKLSTQELKNHDKTERILEKADPLSLHDRQFVLDHWMPEADIVAREKAFFTPRWMSAAVAMEAADDGRVVDLCAGIGSLSWYMTRENRPWALRPGFSMTAIEKNPRFVEIGKRLLPEVEWIQGDVFSRTMWDKIGPFDSFITNPPFGMPARVEWLRYGEESSLMVVEVGLRYSRWGTGTAILPQSLCPFRYSGVQEYKQVPPLAKTDRFLRKVPALMQVGATDTTVVPEGERDFRDTSTITEIVNFDLMEEGLLWPRTGAEKW